MKRLMLTLSVLVVLAQTASTQDGDDLAARAAEFRQSVTELRGLEFKKEVTVGVYSREELLEFLKGEIDKEFPREKAARYQKAYAHFGLIPKDMDLYDAALKLLSSAIAGFYHPKTKELRLIQSDEADPAMKAMNEQFKTMFGVTFDDITLVHELCHAAQDQHFDLDTLPLDDETNDDMISAVKAVVEGDANTIGFRFGLKGQFDAMIKMITSSYRSGQLPGEAGTLPAYLRETLAFPYGYGADFVLAYLKQTEGEPEDTTKLFNHFPTSSEQILHPEKYASEHPDWPTLITFEDLRKTLGIDAETLVSNVHGEFCVKILLKEAGLKGKAVRTAAEGWDGDRYVIFDDNGTVFSTWYTTWDTEADAAEFVEQYAAVLSKKYPDAKSEAGESTVKKWIAGDRWVVLEQRGQDVLVLDNVTEAVAGKIGGVFEAAKKSELSEVKRTERTETEKEEEKKPKEYSVPGTR